ncbi:MAG: sigma-70 family RNA polymerase sigma factor [Pirellula sp.]
MNQRIEEIEELLESARQGKSEAIGSLFERFRSRLLRVVRFRLDRRLLGRIDPNDVIQDAYLEAMTRLPEYFLNEKMPFFLWLRFLTLQKLLIVHRHHLGTKARDAGREISLWGRPLPGASSVDLAAQLLGRFTSPSQAAMKAEIRLCLEEAMNSMESIDREVLALRHLEQLNNVETASVLGIKPTTASNRYVRAIKRLKSILDLKME